MQKFRPTKQFEKEEKSHKNKEGKTHKNNKEGPVKTKVEVVIKPTFHPQIYPISRQLRSQSHRGVNRTSWLKRNDEQQRLCSSKSQYKSAAGLEQRL